MTVRVVEAELPTEAGTFRAVGYRDGRTGAEHVALVHGDLREAGACGVLVRVHSECLTGDAFGSARCDCGPQLQAALHAVAHEPAGIVVYLRGHEGRGIGLLNKLRAYALQDDGLDTLDANLALGLPADARDYAAAVDILRDLGVSSVRLLTNNPHKVEALREGRIDVLERVPLVTGVRAENVVYLRTKAARFGHALGVVDADGAATTALG